MAKEILNGNSNNPIKVEDTSDPVLDSAFDRVVITASDTQGNTGRGVSHSGDREEARYNALKNYHEKK